MTPSLHEDWLPFFGLFMFCHPARGLAIFRTTETEMVTSGIHFSFAARPHHVARTILVAAEKGAAPLSAFPLGWLGGIERRFRSLWIERHATGGGQSREVVRPIPITAPLPNIAGHVVKPISVWRK